MKSPICEVKDGGGAWVATTDGVDVTPGNVISVRLADPAGVNVWTLIAVGSDETTDYTVIVPVVNQVTKVATFTMPTGTGRAIILQSQVDSGRNANNRPDASLTTTLGVFALTGGYRVIAVNERYESNAVYGWIVDINTWIRTGVAPTALVVASPDYAYQYRYPDGTLAASGEFTASSGAGGLTGFPRVSDDPASPVASGNLGFGSLSSENLRSIYTYGGSRKDFEIWCHKDAGSGLEYIRSGFTPDAVYKIPLWRFGAQLSFEMTAGSPVDGHYPAGIGIIAPGYLAAAMDATFVGLYQNAIIASNVWEDDLTSDPLPGAGGYLGLHKRTARSGALHADIGALSAHETTRHPMWTIDGVDYDLLSSAAETVTTITATPGSSLATSGVGQIESNSASSTTVLPGLVAPAAGVAKRILLVNNNGDGATFQMDHANGGETAANRFDCPGGVDFSIISPDARWWYYCHSASRWRLEGAALT